MKWEKVRLGDVTDSCLGKMLDQEKNRGEYQKYLANVNVRWGSFDLEALSEMRFEDSENERYGLKYGERHLSTASLMQINEEKYFLIRDGIPVTVKKPDGKPGTRTAAVIDFQHPAENHFLAIKELKIHGDLYRKRTDIVGFVNGIPLLFVELKKHNVDVQSAYTENYTDYLDTIPHLFYYNAFLMLSNGVEAKVGTLGSKYEFFHE